MDAVVAVLTDESLLRRVTSFQRGESLLLLQYECEAYSALETPSWLPSHLRDCNRLCYAIVTGNRHMQIMLLDSYRPRNCTTLSLWMIGPVVEQLCIHGTSRHLEEFEQWPGVEMEWSVNALQIAVDAFVHCLLREAPDHHERRDVIGWLLNHHREEFKRVRGSETLLFDVRARDVLEMLLRADAVTLNEALVEHGERIDLPLAELLLQVGSDALTGTFPTVCATHGHLDVLRFLHANHHNADELFTNQTLDAASIGHVEVVRYLHDVAERAWSHDAVYVAARRDHVAVVDYLLDNCVDAVAPSDGWPLNEATALIRRRFGPKMLPCEEMLLAARRGDKLAFKELHTVHHSPTVCSGRLLGPNESLLLAVIRRRDCRWVRFLLGSCSEARNEIGVQEINASVHDDDILDLLLEIGADTTLLQNSRLLLGAVERDSLQGTVKLLQYGVPMSTDVLNAAIARPSASAITKHHLAHYPEFVDRSTLTSAATVGDVEIFTALHERFHDFCSPSLQQSILQGTSPSWELLRYLHTHCTQQTFRASDLCASVWEKLSIEALVFLWLVEKSPNVTKDFKLAPRDSQLRLFCHLHYAVPSLLRPYQHKPWRLQMLLLRECVEAGGVSLEDIEGSCN